jgi:hypothetical protein
MNSHVKVTIYIYIKWHPKSIKRVYLYTSKSKHFGRMEETAREDESETYKNIKSTEQCLMRVPKRKVEVLKNILAIICEFMKLYVVEM